MDPAQKVTAAVLQLRASQPFFSGLLLCTRLWAREGLGTAATDGRDIYYDPAFVATLPLPMVAGVLVHEVLHAALLHVLRRRGREALRWNVAADIVVNGMIASAPALMLPEGAHRDEALEGLPAEDVYEQLPASAAPSQGWHDLRPAPPGSAIEAGGAGAAGLEAYWRDALQQAAVLTAAVGRGATPLGWARELDAASGADVDWRVRLWQFLVRTPSDFAGFDRRFVSRGLYLDDLAGDTVHVDVAVDTSGSIDDATLRVFVAEVRAILAAYPGLEAELYYADADVYGPWPLRAGGSMPPPAGGGGTHFGPFFEAIQRRHPCSRERVAVYLTDGHGTFPDQAPDQPVLWVVPSGGADPSSFPFGEVITLRAWDVSA